MNDTTLFIRLLGKSAEEVITELNKCSPGHYRICYTRDPRSCKDKENVEKRVIRIKKRDGFIELLVGYFQIPAFHIST